MNLKTIELTRGYVAQVDDEDFEWLNQWKWYACTPNKANNTYAARPLPRVYVDGECTRTTVSMHKLLCPVPDGILVDHIDMDSLNNQRHNLRPATASSNQWNRGKTRVNTSGYKCVFFEEKSKVNPWIAKITFKGKVYPLGRFATKEEAALAYNEKAIELHGEFARLNVIKKAVED